MLRLIKLIVQDGFRSLGINIIRYVPPRPGETSLPEIRPEFANIKFAAAGLQKLLDEYTFETVLDIGCGAGEHTEAFLRHGKKVTALDYGKSIYFEKNQGRIDTVIGDFNTMEFNQQFDCVWASHVLEHQRNVGLFLDKVFQVTREGGCVCISIPPLQDEILGGHLSFWNAGLLLYNMVHAGFDCREAKIRRYDYNICVIVKKKTAQLPELVYDNGDVNRIAAFLPEGFREGFNGNIWLHNW